MEYTKDIIFNVGYEKNGQVGEKGRIRKKVICWMMKHKFMTTIISLTFVMMIIDFILISSFIQVLSTLV